MGKIGRPRQFGGSPLVVMVPAMLNLRIRALAQETNQGISKLIRAALEEKYGGNCVEEQPKSSRIAY